MKDIFKVVTFYRLLTVEQFKEILYELGSNVDFETANLDRFVYYELEEEFVDPLQVRPRWVHLFFLVNTCFSEAKTGLLYIRQGPENVLFNHLHNLV